MLNCRLLDSEGADSCLGSETWLGVVAHAAPPTPEEGDTAPALTALPASAPAGTDHFSPDSIASSFANRNTWMLASR